MLQGRFGRHRYAPPGGYRQAHRPGMGTDEATHSLRPHKWLLPVPRTREIARRSRNCCHAPAGMGVVIQPPSLCARVFTPASQHRVCACLQFPVERPRRFPSLTGWDEKGTRWGFPPRCRGCPRNCERRARHHPADHPAGSKPLGNREGGVRVTTREPGDLPSHRGHARAHWAGCTNGEGRLPAGRLGTTRLVGEWSILWPVVTCHVARGQ